MWEKTREDGSRKLKSNAVPTIFSSLTQRREKQDQSSTTMYLREISNISGNTTLEDSADVELEQKHCLSLQKSPAPIYLESDKISGNTILEESQSQPLMDVSDISSQRSDETITSSEHNFTILQQLTKKEKIKVYSAICKRSVASKKLYKNKYRRALAKIKQLQNINQQNQMIQKSMHKMFNKDQLIALEKRDAAKSTKFMKWSDDTIVKAFRLKFACGTSGYEELLKQKLPYPSVRTLRRRLQNLKFDSGILHEVFRFLSFKMESFNENEKDCILVLDEMAITPSNTYDTSLNKYFGQVTLPGHSGIATHVLVFMLAGINTRWKQVVGYYFTGNSVNGSVFKDIVFGILEEAKNININIVCITSDMGSCNQALWKTLGITAGRHQLIQNAIVNPTDSSKKIFFIADVPHLFKNIKSSFINNKIITIPKFIQEKYNLQSQKICASHIFELVSYQDNLDFKLAPKLTQNDILPSHYDQMKVSKSTNVISHDVSSALKFVSEELDKPEYLTTAWFIEQLERWFYLMSSRSPANALSKLNTDSYNAAIQFLINFMELIDSVEIGDKKIWKPSQTGILITTKSILQLQEYLIGTRKYQFVLTGRFSQDCLENLFSILRSKQIIPNAVQVKNNLKLISISQYLACPKTSSYEEDDREFLTDFIKVIDISQAPKYDEVKIPEIISFNFRLNNSEVNSLYNIAGYIIHSIKKTSKTCQKCIDAIGSSQPVFKNFSKFTRIKSFNNNSLFFCCEYVFCFFIDLESIFRKFYSIVCVQNIDLKIFFVNKMKDVLLDIPNCHDLKNKIIRRYVTFRLKISSKKHIKLTQKYASKSLR